MKQSKNSLAIVRPVPTSYSRCVRTNTEEIEVERARLQHREYCRALQRMGLKLIWAKRADSLPDSCFVEDTATILEEKAVICNLSVKSRAPEVLAVAGILKNLKQVNYIKPPATIDGGDVLKVEDKVFLGLTARTNRQAVGQVKQIVEDSSLQVIPVKVRNVLHLKSACTYLGGNYVVLSKGNFDTSILSGLNKIVVPKGEEYAADCLAVNEAILMPKGYRKTKRLMEEEGFNVRELELSEFRKGDGAVTCLSIVW